MARSRIHLASIVPALLFSCLLSNPVFSRGTYNTRESIYREDMKDAADMDLVQALVPNAGGYMEVAGAWTWYQPGKPAANNLAHSTKFSSAGSLIQFTTIGAGGGYGEQVHLKSQWFSAVTDMTWSSNSICGGGDASQKCIVKPVQASPVETAFGAHSSSVLFVPNVYKYSSCDSQPTCKPTDFIVASLNLPQRTWNDLLVPGFPYSATFFLRYPGAGGAPLAPSTRMAKLVAYYSYLVGAIPQDEYMGGATTGPNDLGLNNCAQRKNEGCPYNLVSDNPGKGEQDFYLGPVYNPFTISFCAGKYLDYYPLEPGSRPPRCYRCSDPASLTYPACRDPLEGNWVFMVKVDNALGCKCDTIDCAGNRAVAPLYFDGIQITAGGVRINDAAGITTLVHEDAGSYVSPVFDSLSPFTQWTDIAWVVEQNRDANGWVTTPVRLKWRAGNTANPAVAPYWVGADGYTYQDMVPFDTPLEGMVDNGARIITYTGQYFQYEANLTSWSENLLNSPPRRAPADYKSCIRYPINYDGTLTPEVRQVAVTYIPDAGQFISKTIKPEKLRLWKFVRFEKEDGGGTVTVDILDASNSVIRAGIVNGEPISGLDPGQYPAIRIRATLRRNGVGAAVPKFKSFLVEYEAQESLITPCQNSIRLSRNDETCFRVYVEKSGMVEVKVYDAAGQMVKGIFRGEVKGPQMLQVVWNGRDSRGNAVSPGVYFVTAITPAGRGTGRVAVTR